MVVASNDADASVRSVAVRDMLSALERGGIDADELVCQFLPFPPLLKMC